MKDTLDGETNYCTHENNSPIGVCDKCMGNKDTLKEIVNDYGNAVVEITLDFIKGHYTEEARDKSFREAGNILVGKIETLIEQNKSNKGEIVSIIEKQKQKYIKNNEHELGGWEDEINTCKKIIKLINKHYGV